MNVANQNEEVNKGDGVSRSWLLSYISIVTTYAFSWNDPHSGSFCVGIKVYLGLILYCTRLFVTVTLVLGNITAGSN